MESNPFIIKNRPAVVLAPMEGVTDAPLRSFLTRTGQYDYCVSEFIRVSENVLQEKNFHRLIPELKSPIDVPVLVQLLGGDPERLAQSAQNAVLAGAKGIDLNFGCPAPTVNRHDGGATLLKYPERIEKIVRAVRDALPSHITVSAKLRLGFDDPSVIDENSKRCEQGGANWIAIHGRTKLQGYIPPAFWDPIGRVNKSLKIPVIANGEIWTIEDFKKCREETGCEHFMIGRGALAFPNLANEIRRELKLKPVSVFNPLQLPIGIDPYEWGEIFEQYGQPQNRIKQWARYLNQKRKLLWWDKVKTAQSTFEILDRLKQDDFYLNLNTLETLNGSVNLARPEQTLI